MVGESGVEEILGLDDLAKVFRVSYEDSDDRRVLIRTKMISFNVMYVGIIKAKAPSMLGNHYHSRKEEVISVVEGRVVVRLEDIESGKRAIGELSEGEGILIEPGLAHSVSVTAVDSILLELCDKPLEEVVGDVEPYVIEW